MNPLRIGKILIACEESQAVCRAFRALGYEAYSCDILPCSGGHPEWHIQGDVLSLLEQEWDMIIAFPPCTHLAVSGAAHFAKKIADGRQQEGIDFFMQFANAKCPKIAIENPVGIMSSKWRKPDQIIQPYQFGEPFSKKTCLWLKGLPPLVPTKTVEFNSEGLAHSLSIYDIFRLIDSLEQERREKQIELDRLLKIVNKYYYESPKS